ncbi:uncharacterized protein LOC131650310 [Vicia villosa]|uniref:uncharacterized protein LOC131650310 n=1 Tax=Vicia villosa TaxID=3911 RepID=UPI00273C8201|nr:uncharacterized protein LOC131650310 [Vicia villosa]
MKISIQVFNDGVSNKVLSSSYTSCSTWWRDIIRMENFSFKDPIAAKSRNIIQNDFSTPFWEAKWIEDVILKEVYPDLFLAYSLKGVSIAGMGGWNDGEWRWGDFSLSTTVANNLELLPNFSSLKDQLEEFGGLLEGRDMVGWTFNSEEDFSVASCYALYACFCIPLGPPNRYDEALGLVWKAEVPFKIKTFGWRLLVNRLPTKDLLMYKGISFPLNSLKCILCDLDMENQDHTFFNCKVSKKVWREITNWVGKSDSEKKECFSNFMN